MRGGDSTEGSRVLLSCDAGHISLVSKVRDQMPHSLTSAPPNTSSAVIARLSEPQTAAALNTLLDHADLLAISVVALDGLVGRSEVIGDALVSGFDALRG